MVFWHPYPILWPSYPWYFDPPTYGILTPLPMIYRPLPMVFWPPTHGVSASYPWYFDPLPMVYGAPYPWYFDPPTHGILIPLPMVHRPLYPWYFDSPTHGGSIYHTRGSRYHMTPVLSSFMTYHRICNQINTTSTTSGAGTAYLSRAPESSPGS